MPVTFAQQEPFNANAAAGAGAAQYAQPFQLANQRAQNQMAVNQEELNQAEKLRLQRLQQGLSAVQEQIDNGILTPEEGNALRLQVQTGINPLQQRQQAAQTAHIESQTKQAFQQMHIQQQMYQQRQELDAQGAASRMQTIWLPNGDQLHVLQGANGELHPMGRSQGGSDITPQVAGTLMRQTIQSVNAFAQQESVNGRQMTQEQIDALIHDRYTTAVQTMQQNMPNAPNAVPRINFQGAQQMLALSSQFMPPQVVQQLGGQLQSVRQLLQTWHHPNNMPAQVRQQFDAAMQQLGQAGLLAQPSQPGGGGTPGGQSIGQPAPAPQPAPPTAAENIRGVMGGAPLPVRAWWNTFTAPGQLAATAGQMAGNHLAPQQQQGVQPRPGATVPTPEAQAYQRFQMMNFTLPPAPRPQ